LYWVRGRAAGIVMALACLAPIAVAEAAQDPVVGTALLPFDLPPPRPVPSAPALPAPTPTLLPPVLPAPVQNGLMPAPTPTIVVIPPVALPPAPLPPDPQLVPLRVALEILRLRQSFAAEVPHAVTRTPDADRHWIALARAQIAGSQVPILRTQLLVVVDRATSVQQLALLVARPDAPWEVIGAVHVSTGQAGRYDHYVTPTGVYRHTDAILDYRAQGTYNENHIRGLGLKGMRVWDFGWQWARKGWSPEVGKPQETQIRLEMHATDPAILEARIGRTASQGCVRIPSPMNRFMDLHGVLDATYERLAVNDIRYRALLLASRTPSILAGDALVIVDSSERPGTPSDQRAERRPAVGAPPTSTTPGASAKGVPTGAVSKSS
jgi:lipoprotein-anchoring transpeptidase ErfK/SrfK